MGRITTLHLKRSGDRGKLQRHVRQLIEKAEFEVPVTPLTATVSDMARAVVRRADQYDLLVVGLCARCHAVRQRVLLGQAARRPRKSQEDTLGNPSDTNHRRPV